MPKSFFVLSCLRGPLFVALLAASASCAPKLSKLPTGPGSPASDFAMALDGATETCRTVQSITSSIAVTGSVAGQRVRANLFAGAAPASARLEAIAPAGAPLFVFVATGTDGTLLLPHDGRVVEHGDPAQLLASVAGVPLSTAELFSVLTGCARPERLDTPQAIGDSWRTAAGTGGAKIYLHRSTPSEPWRLVTVLFPGQAQQWDWRADYDGFQNGLPGLIRLASADGRRFNLELKLSQVETNVRLAPEVFRVDIPRDAERITIEELRRSGPLGNVKPRG